MEKADNPAIEPVMKALREGIKIKYGDYHRQNEKRFPTLDYNTNRVNYEPLADSFREEFYVVRGVDRAKNTIHIPSTKTFATIFCDEHYVPGKKILNTCRSYAEGASQIVVEESTSATRQVSATSTSKKTNSILRVAGIILLVGVVSCLIIDQLYSTPSARGLVIYRPQKKQSVTRKSFIEGTVLSADTIWVVVRPQHRDEYYFQLPIVVEHDSTWRGQMYVGSASEENVGLTFEVRAFVKPVGVPESLEVIESVVLTAWPEAELSSNVLVVVRGPEKGTFKGKVSPNSVVGQTISSTAWQKALPSVNETRSSTLPD
jgi:hypothetical protein